MARFCFYCLVVSLLAFYQPAWAQDKPDPDAAEHLAIAQAKMNAKYVTTQPDVSTNDPRILRAIIAGQSEEITALRAQLAAAKTASIQTNGGIRSIAGIWQEGPDVFLTISQTQERWTAKCTYTSDDSGEISWVMAGTISVDGEIEGTLRHTKAPPNWEQTQNRSGTVSPDNQTISGTSKWDGGGGSFSWTRADNTTYALATPEIKGAIEKHKLVIGMTLDECNAALLCKGEITAENVDSTHYEWHKPWRSTRVVRDSGTGKDVPEMYVVGSTEFDGTMQKGRLTAFENGPTN